MFGARSWSERRALDIDIKEQKKCHRGETVKGRQAPKKGMEVILACKPQEVSAVFTFCQAARYSSHGIQ